MAKTSILIVDDTLLIRKSLQRMLSDEGYDVDVASNGAEAMDKIKSRKRDLVFTDLMMPGMDGVEACREIKKISPDTVVILMTGNLEREVTEKETAFEEAGGKVYYLYKPFEDGEVLEVVQKALGER